MRGRIPGIRGMMAGRAGDTMGARVDTAAAAMVVGMGAAGTEPIGGQAEAISSGSVDTYSGIVFIFLCHPAQSRPFASRKMQKPTKAGSRWKKST